MYDDDDDSLLDDTIDNDLLERQNNQQGPIRSQIEQTARNVANEAARKAKRKIKFTLFNPVGISLFSVFFTIFVVVFMIIGIISFITSMPGMVQEKIVGIINDVVGGIKYELNGSDYYLTELANDPERKKQTEVLKYLNSMGIDPASFGFAAFYYENEETGVVSYEPPIITTHRKAEDIDGLIDAYESNGRLAERIKEEDLIFKYIVSNERAYLVDDKDKVGKILNWGDAELRGMIKATIQGLDDSKISVDRTNKQLVVESVNLEGLSLKSQTVKYSMEGWTGRYGTSLEFLLALHIATMTSDLTEEMVTNPNLQTEVELGMPKADYDVSYTVKYDGKEFPIRSGGLDTSKDLEDFTGDKWLEHDTDTDTFSMPLEADEIEEFKEKMTIESLYDWIYHVTYHHDARTEIYQNIADITDEAKEAFLGDDTFRVSFHMAFNVKDYPWEGYSDTEIPNTLDWVAYLGKMDLAGEAPKVIKDIIGNYITEKEDGVTNYINKDVYDRESYYAPELLVYDDESKIRFDVGSWERTVDSQQAGYITGTMHGIQYYIDNIEELKDSQIALNGITAMLSQFDSYLYWELSELHELYPDDEKVESLMNEFTVYVRTGERGEQFPYHVHIPLWSSINDDQVDIAMLLSKDWLDFAGGGGYEYVASANAKSNDEIRSELQRIVNRLNYYYDAVDEIDKVHLTSEQRQQVLTSVIKQLDIGIDDLKIEELELIYEAIKDRSDTYEMVLPRIKHVIKHWYKDVMFEGYSPKPSEALTGKDSVYTRSTDSFDAVVEGITDPKLEITAHFSGGGSLRQKDEPYVIKGDVVTLDGEKVDGIDKVKTTIEDYDGNEYTLGNGYRTTKKLFTQGQYYTFDGSKETAQSIYFAKEIEKLENKITVVKEEYYDESSGQTVPAVTEQSPRFARIMVRNGRIELFLAYEDARINGDTVDHADLYNFDTNTWNTSLQFVDDERKDENIPTVISGDGYSIFLYKAQVDANGVPNNIYYIKVDDRLEYKSPAKYSVEETNYSVARINKALTDMGIITIRKPISFDNTTNNGDVTSLMGLSILAGMHTEDAEYIYRDLKEFLIELGYYTKAEFEYLDTKVLNWFIPEYHPQKTENQVNWRQNKGDDALYYGAFIYPKSTEASTDNGSSESKDTDEDGFEPNLEVVAPGNCRIVSAEDKTIILRFDGQTQPEIGILDRFEMTIVGITLNTSQPIEVIDRNGNELGEKTLAEILENNNDYIVKANSVIGYTGNVKIQVVMKNSRGGKIDNIEDYMGPNIATANIDVPESAYYYFIPYEGGTPGMVSSASNLYEMYGSNGAGEVAVGIGQWTTVVDRNGNIGANRVPEACKKMYEKDPSFCAELQTFITWTPAQIFADYYEGGNQLVNAFKMIEARDKDKFMDIQKQVIAEEKAEELNSYGVGWVASRSPVTVGTVWSLFNWGQGMGWQNHMSESMSDREIIISLLKYASTQTSTAGKLNDRWNSQARLALDILEGRFTDIEDWIANKGSYPEYNEGQNPGYLDSL